MNSEINIYYNGVIHWHYEYLGGLWYHKNCEKMFVTLFTIEIFFITIGLLQGGVPERFIGAVLKTVVRASVPWVRIPPPPFLN